MRGLKILTVLGMLSFSVVVLSYSAYRYFIFEPPAAPNSSGDDRSEEDSGFDLKALSRRAAAITSLSEGAFSARSQGRRIYVDIPNKSLFFESNSHALRPGVEKALRTVLDGLGEYTHLLVNGHADSSGEWLHNYILSKQRAEEVSVALVNLGVNPEDITAQGFGEAEPAASNLTEEGKSLNRRVQIEAIYGSKPEPVTKIVTIREDSCEHPATWEEDLACSLKNNTWVLLLMFSSAVVTLVGGSAQLVKGFSR